MRFKHVLGPDTRTQKQSKLVLHLFVGGEQSDQLKIRKILWLLTKDVQVGKKSHTFNFVIDAEN